MRRTHRIGKRVTEAVGGRAAGQVETLVASHDRHGAPRRDLAEPIGFPAIELPPVIMNRTRSVGEYPLRIRRERPYL